MKGILFNTEAVQAILDGRKTQTRRLMKEQVKNDGKWGYTALTPDGHISFRKTGYDGEWFFKLPYQPGDILYVRETFSIDENGEHVYRTNYGTTEDDSFPPSMFKWKSSRHMPKEASRIFLKVTDIRVERVQDIDYMGALAEGIEETEICNEMLDECSAIGTGTGALPVQIFAMLWDNFYEKNGYGWDSNPWIWIIEFERCEKPDEN